MNRRDQAELIVAVTESFSMIGDNIKRHLLKLPPGILVNLILILGVPILGGIIFKFLLKNVPPIRVPNIPIPVGAWVIPDILASVLVLIILL